MMKTMAEVCAFILTVLTLTGIVVTVIFFIDNIKNLRWVLSLLVTISWYVGLSTLPLRTTKTPVDIIIVKTNAVTYCICTTNDTLMVDKTALFYNTKNQNIICIETKSFNIFDTTLKPSLKYELKIIQENTKDISDGEDGDNDIFIEILNNTEINSDKPTD